jgi:hypothetical protein
VERVGTAPCEMKKECGHYHHHKDHSLTNLQIDCLTSDAPLLRTIRDLSWPEHGQCAGDDVRPPARWLAHLRNEPVLIPNAMWKACDERADIIVADYPNRGDLRMHLGVRTHWTVLWHRDFRLFMPRVARASFVPDAFGNEMHFVIDENGRLEARESVPYRTFEEYEKGCTRAFYLLSDRLGSDERGMAIAC